MRHTVWGMASIAALLFTPVLARPEPGTPWAASRSAHTFALRLRPGQDLLAGLREFAQPTIYTTAEIVLGEMDEVAFAREPDSTYGYRELVPRPRGR